MLLRYLLWTVAFRSRLGYVHFNEATRHTETTMTSRTETALQVLAAGGYFRKQLENHYHGGEKFKLRLRNVDGSVVKGIGSKTFYELQDAGKLVKRPCATSSVWPEEWTLKAKDGPSYSDIMERYHLDRNNGATDD